VRTIAVQWTWCVPQSPMYIPCTLGMSICRVSCAAYGFHDAAPDSHGTTTMSRHWMSEYAAAYYWASMTVTTIGYGDIVRSCCVSFPTDADGCNVCGLCLHTLQFFSSASCSAPRADSPNNV
jgi:hypothetical protein